MAGKQGKPDETESEMPQVELLRGECMTIGDAQSGSRKRNLNCLCVTHPLTEIPGCHPLGLYSNGDLRIRSCH